MEHRLNTNLGFCCSFFFFFFFFKWDLVLKSIEVKIEIGIKMGNF